MMSTVVWSKAFVKMHHLSMASWATDKLNLSVTAAKGSLTSPLLFSTPSNPGTIGFTGALTDKSSYITMAGKVENPVMVNGLLHGNIEDLCDLILAVASTLLTTITARSAILAFVIMCLASRDTGGF
jgi:hypothetical protein